MRVSLFALMFALPATAMAQQFYPANPMTSPVTPRTVDWYMSNPDVMNQTLRVCHSNAAYGPTSDCQNAERAATGLMAQQKQHIARTLSSSFYSPTFWDQNPIMRSAIITQCNRRGPGDVRPVEEDDDR